jgi:hypothetical protein
VAIVAVLALWSSQALAGPIVWRLTAATFEPSQTVAGTVAFSRETGDWTYDLSFRGEARFTGHGSPYIISNGDGTTGDRLTLLSDPIPRDVLIAMAGYVPLMGSGTGSLYLELSDYSGQAFFGLETRADGGLVPTLVPPDFITPFTSTPRLLLSYPPVLCPTSGSGGATICTGGHRADLWGLTSLEAPEPSCLAVFGVIAGAASLAIRRRSHSTGWRSLPSNAGK